MRRILVTGGAGFIGSNFVHYWRRTHPDDRIVVLDALTYAGNRGNLAGLDESSFRFVHADIADQELVTSLLRDEKLDTIVHLAAESHVDRSIDGPDAFMETNVAGTHSLLKAARRVWLDERQAPVHRFHHVSTDEVFGSLGLRDAPFTETTAYAPKSPYSASKAASDHLVRAYHHTYGLQVTTSNCSNNYGRRQFPEKLVPLCIVNMLLGKPLPIYGDGGNVREWLHVDDHCRGIDMIIGQGIAGEVYNLGSGDELANLDLVTRLCGLVDAAFARSPALAARFPCAPGARGEPARTLITFVADRAGHDLRYAMDSSKAKRKLGFEARHDLMRGLGETVDWYLENEHWWRAVLSGKYRDASLAT
ncbi:MAG TPA: dTDP-glucose 4,6-dehydratase [Steroidobacteraceae bacterium]|nr:dTDP-glucose 4,6-dehydratase [Steroidobacteraceae bacterium]